MDPASRNIILKNQEYLSTKIDLYELKPFLKKYAIFTNAMLDDIYSIPTDYDFFVELVTRGPDAFKKFTRVLKEAGYSHEANIFETNSSNIIRKRQCYKMNSKPYVGYCFIINNVKFEENSYRYGSDVDAAALSDLFKKLGFYVFSENNLKAQEMIVFLQKFSEKDWSAVDSCVLFILSHGDKENNLDIIYGSDSKYVLKNEIYQIFNNVNCDSLKFKPKMFFFLACRGDEEDFGVFSKVSTDASKVVKLPTMSNMIAINSTLPNHPSYRDHEKGTFFCQDLIQVFSSDYLTEDLETMLKTVAQKLELRLSLSQGKQIPHIEHYGFKAYVYFSMENVADICEIYDPRSSFAP